MSDRSTTAIVVAMVVWLLICLALVGGAIFVLIHFIGKFW